MSSSVSTKRSCLRYRLRQRHQRHPHARLRAGRCRRHPPRGPRHPQALRAHVGQKRGAWRSTSWRSSTPPSPDIGCLKADTGPPCCDAALRVPSGNSSPPAPSIVLASYSKTAAARLGRRPERRHRTGFLTETTCSILGAERIVLAKRHKAEVRSKTGSAHPPIWPSLAIALNRSLAL